MSNSGILHRVRRETCDGQEAAAGRTPVDWYRTRATEVAQAKPLLSGSEWVEGLGGSAAQAGRGSRPEPPSEDATDMHAHFTPWAEPRPCWHCQHFERLEAGGCARCNLTGGPRRRAQPERGCSAWTREPGADDEPGPPIAAEPTACASATPPSLHLQQGAGSLGVVLNRGAVPQRRASRQERCSAWGQTDAV